MRCKTACAGEDNTRTCPAGMTGPKNSCLGTGFREGRLSGVLCVSSPAEKPVQLQAWRQCTAAGALQAAGAQRHSRPQGAWLLALDGGCQRDQGSDRHLAGTDWTEPSSLQPITAQAMDIQHLYCPDHPSEPLPRL